MRFKRSAQAYGRTPDPTTPFQRAGQLWDMRIGSARVQARNWRAMAFGCLVLSGAMATGVLWLSMQSRVVPYVVAVDRLGEPRAISEAEASYQPTDPQIAWALSNFIRDVRGASLDPVVMRDGWLQAYEFTTDRGGRFLSEYARASGALSRVGERTVSIQVTSVVRASDKSFQVKWREDAYDRGNFDGATQWTAILTVAQKAPKDAETLRHNPLGIYVDAIDWSQELDPQGTGRGTQGRSSAAFAPAGVAASTPASPSVQSPQAMEVLP